MIYQAASQYISNLPTTNYSVDLNDYNAINNHYIPKFWLKLTGKDYYGILQSLFPNTNNGYRINFEDDLWDFYPYQNTGNHGLLRISYSSIKCPFIKDSLKFYCIYLLSIRKKPQSICLYVRLIKSVIDKLNVLTIEKLNSLSSEDIIEIINLRDSNINYKKQIYFCISDYFGFLKNNYDEYDGSIDTKKIESINKNIKAAPIDNRHPLIPWKYFNTILNKSISVYKNKKEPLKYRMMAALIVILSQTGLRIIDALSLTKNCIEECSAPDGTKIHLISYVSHKPSKVDTIISLKCFCNDICYQAIKTLIMLNALTNNQNNDLLFNPDIGSNNTKYRNYVVRLYNSFMVKYLFEEVNKQWEGLDCKPLYVNKKGNIDNTNYIVGTVPTFHSFRVNVCTMLTESKMFSKTFIRHYMGHLSNEMDNYYSRPKDLTPDINYVSAKALNAIIMDDVIPLGGRNDGNALHLNVIDFIKKNRINIMKEDPISLLQRFKGHLSFRALKGGCCIKIIDEDTPCYLNGNKNQLNCAYGVCGNIYHFFYNLPETMAEFRMSVVSYTNAVMLHRDADAERELNRSNYFANRAQEELTQLQELLLNNPQLESEYPELKETILNIDTIKLEINKWKKI